MVHCINAVLSCSKILKNDKFDGLFQPDLVNSLMFYLLIHLEF